MAGSSGVSSSLAPCSLARNSSFAFTFHFLFHVILCTCTSQKEHGRDCSSSRQVKSRFPRIRVPFFGSLEDGLFCVGLDEGSLLNLWMSYSQLGGLPVWAITKFCAAPGA